MNKTFILLSMIFLHIVDDYYLQGKLASLKQKKWWEEHYPDKIYRYDYIVALLTHGFSWSFLVMSPIAIVYNSDLPTLFFLLFVFNCIIHSFVDTLKANMFKINLAQDQTIHFLQILITWLILL